MKPKLPTLKELRKNWWWKRKSKRHDEPGGMDWPQFEESARNYELLRRSLNGKQFVKTYPQLIPDEKRIVFKLWLKPAQGAYRLVRDRNQFAEKGWTPIYENQHRQWNLRLTDKQLMDEFIREIRVLRKIQKIRTSHGNKGRKPRGVSWKLVELLDCQQNGMGKFNASERHTLSDARQRAEKYCRQYEHAVAKWHKSGANPDFDMEKPDGDYGTAHVF